MESFVFNGIPIVVVRSEYGVGFCVVLGPFVPVRMAAGSDLHPGLVAKLEATAARLEDAANKRAAAGRN